MQIFCCLRTYLRQRCLRGQCFHGRACSEDSAASTKIRRPRLILGRQLPIPGVVCAAAVLSCTCLRIVAGQRAPCLHGLLVHSIEQCMRKCEPQVGGCLVGWAPMTGILRELLMFGTQTCSSCLGCSACRFAILQLSPFE